ncbi:MULTISPECIES: TrbM/KikA/MpfK family conjugal transfer protein [Avibacterium]|uniref:TrbM/KikA/MpfK family conjugal transfer protein n=1 Tax=Avibacterium TaxID=292486 RepID=UPI002ED8B48A
MKKTLTLASTLAMMTSINAFADTTSPAIEMLTGDTRTACEVILCLSSSQGKSIAECQAPLRKYFSIRAKKWHKTLAKRRKFLDLCPAANENAKMSALTTIIQHQEYACDAATLNDRTETKYVWGRRDEDGTSFRSRRLIRTQTYLPKFCQDLYKHEFTAYNLNPPKYTCDASKWYSKSDWDRGYERVVVSKRWNNRTDSYSYTYKDVPIKKDCWEQPK